MGMYINLSANALSLLLGNISDHVYLPNVKYDCLQCYRPMARYSHFLPFKLLKCKNLRCKLAFDLNRQPHIFTDANMQLRVVWLSLCGRLAVKDW